MRAVGGVQGSPTRMVLDAPERKGDQGLSGTGLRFERGDMSEFVHRRPQPSPWVEFSVLVECRKRDLFDFPFLRDGKAAAGIILSAEATERERMAAGRLAAYFEYYHSRVKNLTASVDQLADSSLPLPIIVEGQAIPEGMASIVLGTRQTHKGLAAAQSLLAGVTILSGRLLIAGRQPEEVDKTVIGLLRILDEKHPSTWAIYSDDMTRKAGVAGKDFTGDETPPAVEAKPEPEGPIALPASNLLRNGGFEEGEAAPTAWNFSSPNPDEHKCEFTKDAREGQRAVLVPRGQYWQQAVKLEPGRKYRLSVWRKLGTGGSLLLWWCGLREDGSEAGGARLYEQCRPDNDLVPNFLPASYFSQPDVWNYTETTFTAPNYPQISIRLGGWGKVAVDAAVLEPQ